MKTTLLAFAFLISIGPSGRRTGPWGKLSAGPIASLRSPDKHQRLELALDTAGNLTYRYLSGDTVIIDWSPLGFITTADNPRHLAKTRITTITAPISYSHKFAWPLGENATIDNTYNQFSVSCRRGSLVFTLDIRLYNGSAAFRYLLPKKLAIRRELTGFQPQGAYLLYQYNQESVFTPTAIDTLQKTCDLPATLTNGYTYVNIGEADNEDYTKAELIKSKNGLALTYPRDTVVTLRGAMPWRTISIASTAIGLHRCSDLNLKLTPPEASPQNIRPGKLIRAKLTTRAGLDCIDFAAKHHFQYVLFDAGWYGAEFRTVSDPAKPIAAIDMPAVIRYGKAHGIGIILYVNYAGLRARLDTILPLYKQWGVAGLKFGFVDGLTQDGIRWLAKAIKKTTAKGFILDIHDNYKPTGLSRRWPGLLTQEGVRGDEHGPDAFHTTVLPFTRFLAGPADFTFCYPNVRNSFAKNLKVSKAQQLALTVIYFSPLQSIFWYGDPNDYTDEKDIEFFTFVPTVWDETHYLAGEIGKYISVARRHGDTWFIGNAAGPQEVTTSVRLDFLKAQRTYDATIYEDDGHGGIAIRHEEVKAHDLLNIHLPAAGGEAMILRPASSQRRATQQPLTPQGTGFSAV